MNRLNRLPGVDRATQTVRDWAEDASRLPEFEDMNMNPKQISDRYNRLTPGASVMWGRANERPGSRRVGVVTTSPSRPECTTREEDGSPVRGSGFKFTVGLTEPGDGGEGVQEREREFSGKSLATGLVGAAEIQTYIDELLDDIHRSHPVVGEWLGSDGRPLRETYSLMIELNKLLEEGDRLDLSGLKAALRKLYPKPDSGESTEGHNGVLFGGSRVRKLGNTALPTWWKS